MHSSDGGDHFIGDLCPDEGLWIGVGVVDEAVGGVLEFLKGTEDTPLEARDIAGEEDRMPGRITGRF